MTASDSASGEHPGGRRAGHRWLALAWAFAVATILGQIAWVLVPIEARVPVTQLTVTTFFLASATHATVTRGARWAAAYLAITMGIGWLVEAVGTATSWPFGDYRYTDLLGPHLGSVPIVIPMAWAMMAYPVLLATRRLTTHRVLVPLVGGFLFASWDLFLDPQMVAEGYWVWHHLGWTLPGIDNIPAQNFAGWLATAVVLMLLLDALPTSLRDRDERVPAVMLTWVYLSNVLSSAAFFGRPAVAVWGGLCMGMVIVPWWITLARSRRDARTSA